MHIYIDWPFFLLEGVCISCWEGPLVCFAGLGRKEKAEARERGLNECPPHEGRQGLRREAAPIMFCVVVCGLFFFVSLLFFCLCFLHNCAFACLFLCYSSFELANATSDKAGIKERTHRFAHESQHQASLCEFLMP